MSNYQRTASWLHACGKEKSDANLSVQIGCHIEEFVEFLDQLELVDPHSMVVHRLAVASEILAEIGVSLKKRQEVARIPDCCRPRALDALCDMEVTGNGVAYLAGFDKEEADRAVLASNDAKLVDGKPVILEGGKIGKPVGWKAPDLSGFV